MLQTWAGCRGEFGLLHLPDPGGYNDQPAWTLAAFDILSRTEAELSKKDTDP